MIFIIIFFFVYNCWAHVSFVFTQFLLSTFCLHFFSCFSFSLFLVFIHHLAFLFSVHRKAFSKVFSHWWWWFLLLIHDDGVQGWHIAHLSWILLSFFCVHFFLYVLTMAIFPSHATLSSSFLAFESPHSVFLLTLAFVLRCFMFYVPHFCISHHTLCIFFLTSTFLSFGIFFFLLCSSSVVFFF